MNEMITALSSKTPCKLHFHKRLGKILTVASRYHEVEQAFREAAAASNEAAAATES